MTPKQRRDRLFKSGRPFIRKLELYDGKSYHKDVGLLWLAYKEKPFFWMKQDLGQDEFARSLQDFELLVVEDKNKNFKTGSGITTVFCEFTDGWKVEPHASYMPWATARNVLRSTVGYLQFTRYKKIGACVVYTTNERLFDRCSEYGVLHKVGTIINGDPQGDVLVYSVRGKRNGQH